MARLDELVTMLEASPRGITAGRPADDALLELLVHLASADGHVDETELAMLGRIRPDLSSDELGAWVARVRATEPDLDHLASAMVSDDERWTTLSFVARMAQEDGVVADDERTFLHRLATALDLSPRAVDRVLHEQSVQRAGRVDPQQLKELVLAYPWESAAFAEGAAQSSDLAPLVPEGATPVMRIGVDTAEVIGLYAEGMVARFLEGPAFLPWSTLVSTSRGSGLAASLRVHTSDGGVWTIIDQRLGGLQLVLDRLHRKEFDLPKGAAPEVLSPMAKEDTWDQDP
ncbi:MAG: TerB family tellurite resistance protein [Alphaproteobacteria bacterium]|nr:TerB family tellurite resistance protein [Alphaproteobacteria bacterium]